MYSPTRYKLDNQELILDIIRNYNFATVIAHDKHDLEISHLPLLYSPSGLYSGFLRGHMAAGNPLWKSFSPQTKVTVIFQGPHAYISPRWYTPNPGNVPTWNYCVVHMTGVAKIIEDQNAAYHEMKRLVENHDPNWNLNLPENEKLSLMAGIKVFEIAVTDIKSKFKLSQNQDSVNRNSVIENLSQSSDQIERETAEFMLELS